MSAVLPAIAACCHCPILTISCCFLVPRLCLGTHCLRGSASRSSFILPAVENGTFHTNPKRKRGNELTPSLALRVGVISNRGEYMDQSFFSFNLLSKYASSA